MKLYTDFKLPSEKAALMNAVILVTETKTRHYKDFWNPNVASMPCNFIFEIKLIFQSTLIAIEIEFIYN